MHKLTRPVVCNQTDNCLIKPLPLQLMRHLSLLSVVSSAPSLPTQIYRHKISLSKRLSSLLWFSTRHNFFPPTQLHSSFELWHLPWRLPPQTLHSLFDFSFAQNLSIYILFFKQMYYSLKCVKTILWADRGTTLGTWKKRQRVVCTCRWGWTDVIFVVYCIFFFVCLFYNVLLLIVYISFFSFTGDCTILKN